MKPANPLLTDLFLSDAACESILDSLADGIFTVDLKRRITYINPSAARIAGVVPAKAVGKKCRDIFKTNVCDSSCPMQICVLKGCKITNKSLFIFGSAEKRVPISISAAPLRNRQGKIIGGVETLRDLTDIHLMRKELAGSHNIEDILTRSHAMLRILEILPQIAASDSTVLIQGESGTGKELVARAIHNLSPRKGKPFVAVNCGALPENLLESELFGYKAGAFTDARRDKAGRFHAAHRGTIFLDEIGDLPLSLQVKILRVLQEKCFEPLGSESSEQADVRVVAASNRDLSQMVAAETFRSDLFYRINVAAIRLPSLRRRPEDIPLLIDHFIAKRNRITGKAISGVSEDVLHLLMRHSFAGNVRELENIIEYASILCTKGFVQLEHLPDYIVPTEPRPSLPSAAVTMAQVRSWAVAEALRNNKGNRSAAAKQLGISRDTLRRIMQQPK